MNQILYYIVNGTATISADNEFPSDNRGNGWTITSDALGTVGSGVMVAKTLPVPSLTAKVWTAYTIAIGDVFYSDGALSHNNALTYSSRTQVGRVFSTTTTAVEKAANSNWKHGWVISNADAATSVYWATRQDNPTGNNINSHNLMKTHMDGYGDTNRIIAAGNSTIYPAAWAAKNYSQSVAISNSGWYLPSDGQFWTMMSNFGDLTTSDIATDPEIDNTYMNWSGKKSDVFATINSRYALNLGGLNWTSSEGTYKSQPTVINSHYWATNYMDDGGNSSCSKMAYQNRVRPVLAF